MLVDSTKGWHFKIDVAILLLTPQIHAQVWSGLPHGGGEGGRV